MFYIIVLSVCLEYKLCHLRKCIFKRKNKTWDEKKLKLYLWCYATFPFCCLQFAWKGGFDSIHDILESDDLDAPVSQTVYT